MRLGQTKDISIAYNAENMPISISNWGNLTTFTYDASGARAAKHVGDSTTGVNSVYYISDAYEVNVDSYGNTVVDKYIFAGNQRVAKVVTYWGYNGVELIPRGSNVNYIHKDHLGSTTVVTDENGYVPDWEPELTQYEPPSD